MLRQLTERHREAREQDGDDGDDASFDPTHPNSMYRALDVVNRFFAFDVETGMAPSDHAGLVEDFAAASDGHLRIECPVQIWHRKDEDDYDAPYTVRFIHAGRLIRFGAENYGDWYDVEAVVNALNAALESAGLPDRYLPLEPAGQVAQFILAPPDTLHPIAEKYGLPLSTDPAAAMRQGQAFEADLFGDNSDDGEAEDDKEEEDDE
jgi:hypothetical protein